MIRLIALLMALCVSLPAYAEKWDEGGFLHGGPMLDWKIAKDGNALASSADYLKWTTAPGKLEQVPDAELKQAATDVMNCMRKAARVPDSRKEDSDKVMMECLAQAKPSYDWVLTKPLEKKKMWIMEEEVDEGENAGASESPEFVPTSPLHYATAQISRDERRAIGRTKLSVRIVLAERKGNKLLERPSQDGITASQLAATIVAAAKYYAEQSKADFVGIVLDSRLSHDGNGTCQLAKADYAPDGRGISGEDDWRWQYVQAAPRGLTQQELKIERLWSELREQYQTADGTDEARLKQVIAKKVGISPDEIHLPYLNLYDIPESFITQIKPIKPLNHK